MADAFLKLIFVIFLPISLLLHELSDDVILTLIGGNWTLNLGSWSKHRNNVDVVKLWIIGYNEVNLKFNVNGGGTLLLLCCILNE